MRKEGKKSKEKKRKEKKRKNTEKEIEEKKERLITVHALVHVCAIGLMSRVFAHGPGFNLSWSHSKDLKMVLDAALLKT